jgi:hypothetical protein
MLHTNGLINRFVILSQKHLERIVSKIPEEAANIACDVVLKELMGFSELTNDLRLVLINRRKAVADSLLQKLHNLFI